MKILITPKEVATLVFGSDPQFDPTLINETTIVAAQEKFIRPVLGKLFESLEKGLYPDLSQEYIKPTLAVFVKLLLLPQLAMKVGNSGITQHHSATFSAVDSVSVYDLERSLRGEGSILLRRAAAYIEAHLREFPEYDPQDSSIDHFTLKGDFIL